MIVLVVLVLSAALNAPAPGWVGAQSFDIKEQCEAAATDMTDRTDKSGGLTVLAYCVPPGDLMPVNPQLMTQLNGGGDDGR